jgi:L-histidine N-alpha-methyltransferase
VRVRERLVKMICRQTIRGSRFEIRNYMTQTFDEEIARDVLKGLTSDQKFIPSKYFYDERGSHLFEEICRLPEYYQTRTEISILEENAGKIVESFDGGDLVEMGSGANWKICRLIDAASKVGENVRYVPVDVSKSALVAASEDLICKYPRLKVFGIVADFTCHMERVPKDRSKLIILFGSTIGNFDEVESRSLLRSVAGSMKSDDRLLVGLDMIKQKEVLENAYNDSRGITCEFNKNILNVINRELNANFDPDLFDHLAFFNEEKERIEMHLLAKKKTSFEVKDLDLSVTFEKGETIHTEISRKFSEKSAIRMFSDANLAIEQWFFDRRGYFSLANLSRAEL